MSKIQLNSLLEKIGPLKGGYKPDSLKMKGKIEEALVKKGFDKVKAAKLAKQFRSGGAEALGKNAAIKVVRALKEEGLFKYEEKDIAGQVSGFLRGQKREAADQQKNSKEKQLARVRQQRAKAGAFQQNRQPEGLTNQQATRAPNAFAQPAFAAPLPNTSAKPADQPAVSPWQTAAPTSNNYPQDADQPATPLIKPADEARPNPEPRDLQID